VALPSSGLAGVQGAVVQEPSAPDAPVQEEAPPQEEAPAQDDAAATFFELNCSACHTIGGGSLKGPDLKDVGARRERGWLVRFVVDPKGVIDGGDPYAQELLEAARGEYMPAIPGLDEAQAHELLDLIERESALEESRFSGRRPSDRPLTREDAERGRGLFTGALHFAAGGPPCASCHTVGGLPGFGGGRLGPDLTTAFARFGGRGELVAYLSEPASETMAPLFHSRPLDPEEILALVAFLMGSAAEGTADSDTDTLAFVLAGIGLAALALMALDVRWRRRFRAERGPLVARS